MLLHWTIIGPPRIHDTIVEVSAEGQDLVDRVQEVIAEGGASPELKRLKNLKPNEGIILGHFEKNGSYFGEYSWDVDIQPKWLAEHMPKSVAMSARGHELPIRRSY